MAGFPERPVEQEDSNARVKAEISEAMQAVRKFVIFAQYEENRQLTHFGQL